VLVGLVGAELECVNGQLPHNMLSSAIKETYSDFAFPMHFDREDP
jgi:hypothetical protein